MIEVRCSWTFAMAAAWVLTGCPKTQSTSQQAADGGSARVVVDASQSGAGRHPDASASDGGSRVSQVDDAGLHCPGFQHSCQCATGAYCLAGNAACIAPGSPCPGAVDAGATDAATADAGSSCPGLQHACQCATGFYCLFGGAACVNPTLACPDHDAGAADGGLHCTGFQHSCQCATGAYCLAGNAACIVPSAPCPP
jgi:hypothetical protein